MKTIFSRLFVGFIVTVVMLSVPTYVKAQSINLSLTPPLIELTIKPDTSLVIAYTLTNAGDPSVFTSYIRPFNPQGINGELVVAREFSGPIRFNLENSNIQLDTPYFLKSGQGQQLLLKIRVPEGTPEGDYYYSFLSENVPGKLAEGTSQPIAQGAIGSNILISVTETGTFESNAQISQFTIKPRYTFQLFGKKFNIIESSDTIPVRLIAKNSGKSLIKPEGTIQLTGGFGGDETYIVLPENILADSSRLLHATPSANIANSQASLDIGGFHLGKYALTASLTFGNKNQLLRSSVIFYALPIKLIMATSIAIIIGIVIIKKFNTPEQIEIKDDDAL